MPAPAKAVCSLEFFPPRTPEALERLRAARREFAALEPAFCSVTFGAGGSTREGTLATVLEFRAEGFDGVPHVSCIDGTRESIREVLARYRSHGIRHLVALRGDLPSGAGQPGEFRYASELVAFIRAETGDWFHIDVAAYPEYHPQAGTPHDDLAAFKRKVDAGANSAITQYFYNADAYWHFVEMARAAGIAVPIVPGIMPIGSVRQARAVFGCVRRRDPALDPAEARGLRRRRRIDSRIRSRRRDRPLRRAARARRARTALLHAEPGAPYDDDLAATRTLTPGARRSGPAPYLPGVNDVSSIVAFWPG